LGRLLCAFLGVAVMLGLGTNENCRDAHGHRLSLGESSPDASRVGDSDVHPDLRSARLDAYLNARVCPVLAEDAASRDRGWIIET
jgi:hypothetical protein